MSIDRISNREILDTIRPAARADKTVERTQDTAPQATPPPAPQMRVAAEQQVAQASQAGTPAAVSGKGTIISVKV